MDRKPKVGSDPPDGRSQSERFKAKARELGVDESGATFERVFGKIVKATDAARAPHKSQVRKQVKKGRQGR